MRLMKSLVLAAAYLVMPAIVAHAQEEVRVDMNKISAQGVGESIGTITVKGEGQGGATLTLDLRGLPPGDHGFHLHENGSCDAAEQNGQMTAGAAAGGHYDPDASKSHQGPEGQGHLGDLPKLTVSSDGSARDELRAPRLSLSKMRGHALVIHEGGDTYSDQPELGGGKGRIACGVIH